MDTLFNTHKLLKVWKRKLHERPRSDTYIGETHLYPQFDKSVVVTNNFYTKAPIHLESTTFDYEDYEYLTSEDCGLKLYSNIPIEEFNAFWNSITTFTIVYDYKVKLDTVSLIIQKMTNLETLNLHEFSIEEFYLAILRNPLMKHLRLNVFFTKRLIRNQMKWSKENVHTLENPKFVVQHVDKSEFIAYSADFVKIDCSDYTIQNGMMEVINETSFEYHNLKQISVSDTIFSKEILSSKFDILTEQSYKLNMSFNRFSRNTTPKTTIFDPKDLKQVTVSLRKSDLKSDFSFLHSLNPPMIYLDLTSYIGDLYDLNIYKTLVSLLEDKN